MVCTCMHKHIMQKIMLQIHVFSHGIFHLSAALILEAPYRVWMLRLDPNGFSFGSSSIVCVGS